MKNPEMFDLKIFKKISINKRMVNNEKIYHKLINFRRIDKNYSFPTFISAQTAYKSSFLNKKKKCKTKKNTKKKKKNGGLKIILRNTVSSLRI